MISHPELCELSVAHIDCDAFYASIEKRDNPQLRNKPVIVGGVHRGVVSTACYIARINGVRSAMPMFQALKLCPEAIVIRGRMDVYTKASRQIRSLMDELSPLVEPISIDEAFISLEGTEKVHGVPASVSLSRLARRIHTEVGITVSIGLSHNKFLAKIASDLNKPDGFSIIGKAETVDFLKGKSVRLLSGVGEVTQAALDRAGIRIIGDLHRWERRDLAARFGSEGERLWHLARGEDYRRVSPSRATKSVSKETTFNEDTHSPEILEGHLWRLSESLSSSLKEKDMAGRVVTLKVKRSDHSVLSRRVSLKDPTHFADHIFREARHLLRAVQHEGPFRLIGVGLSKIQNADDRQIQGDLADPDASRRLDAERATDKIRKRFGNAAIIKGRALK